MKIVAIYTILISSILFLIILGLISYYQIEYQHDYSKSSLYIFYATLGVIAFIISLISLKKHKEQKVRIQISNELRISQERFLLSTEGSGVGIWDWIPGSENVYYSPYFKKMLGYSDHEFPNYLKSFNDILHPDDHDKLWDLVKQHLENNVPFKIEYRLKNKSGKYRWYRAAGQSQRNNQNIATRMLGSIIDVDDMKKLEERLEIQYIVTSALSQSKTLENAAIEIIEKICKFLNWDLGNLWFYNNDDNLLHCRSSWQQESVNVESFKRESYKVTFKPSEGLPGLIWKNKNPIWLSDIKEDSFLRGRAAVDAGLKSGFAFPILLENKVLGIIELFTKKNLKEDHYLVETLMSIGPQIGQFIQRKSAENQFNLIHEYNTAILESASDCIITINESEQLLSFNTQTMVVFKYSANELKLMNISQLIINWKQNRRKLYGTEIEEFTGVKKNGIDFPVEIKISKMELNHQIIMVMFIRDITDRKKVDNIKNEFISIVSHELRTPLTSIRGSLGLILGGAAGQFSDKMKKLLEIANTNSERLLMLINDILDIEKIEAGKMHFSKEIIDVSELINKSILINKPFEIKFGIKFDFIEKESNLRINADPDRFIQVLTNLLSNAAKYSFPNEIVSITLEKKLDNVHIAISNHGPGIPAEFHAQIFQKFSQANTTDVRSKGGTGLGLHITKTIIEKFGGSIHFISEPNKITTFFIDLPIYINESLQTEISNKSELDIFKEKILVCEDDQDQSEFIRALLESSGFHVDIANNVLQAKKLLSTNSYHALILDLILPDQDGISFIRELRKNDNTRDLPIIVMSVIAHTGKKLLNGDAFTVLHWLDKPIDFKQILSIIKKIKKQSAKINILHIEDDHDTTTIVQNILATYANIDAVQNMHEALQAIKNKRYNLAILDLILPDGQGVDLLPLFFKYHIPVIVYSAYELDEQYGQLVTQSLIKSKTSNSQLLEIIKKTLESNISSTIGDEV